MPLYLKLLHAGFAVELAAITPIIALILVVGLITAIIQAALQIEDATFALLPKTIAMIVLALFGGFGALGLFTHFTADMIMRAPLLVHQSWY